MDKISRRLGKGRHIHLIGIGGIGMSGIAQLLMHGGFKVSGSDVKDGEMTARLRARGADISIGHKVNNVKDADIVVYSSAIKDDNPEIMEAKRQKISLLRRAECLAELMQDKTAITVTGMHGKTTTTSLISHLLIKAGFNPTVAIGGILRSINDNMALGDGNFFVAEADESDGSFLHYAPKYSIITNIDYEHLDFFRDLDGILYAFRKFINRTKDGGCIFACRDSLVLTQILKETDKKIITFGISDSADFYANDITFDGFRTQFECFYAKESQGRIDLPLMGVHNVANSLAVIALGNELGIPFGTIKESLQNYSGVERRFQVKMDENGILIVDDYGHHPTEIMATIKAAKNLKKERIIVVFQPHRYTRTKFLWDEFIYCFSSADKVILADIYPAAESPIERVNSLRLSKDIKNIGKTDCIYLPKNSIVGYLKELVLPGDLVLNMGAGDITKLSDELARELKR